MEIKRSVFLVSDNKKISEVFTTSLKNRAELYILNDLSQQEILNHLKDIKPPAVLIADKSYLRADGFELLSRAKELCPEIPRILIVNQPEGLDALSVVNQAGLSSIFVKPLSESDLAAALDNIFKNMEKDVDEVKNVSFGGEYDNRKNSLLTISKLAGAIAHDIKAPITIIRANADMLTWEGLEEEKRIELIKKIEAQADKMNTMIGEILSLARGKWKVDLILEKVDKKEFLERIIEPWKEYAESRGAGVVCNVEFNGWTELDVEKMKRVLQNLVINSLDAKRMDTAVILDVKRSDKNGGILIFKFSDNGPGIASGCEEEIFEPFVSLGKNKGIGLGLTICRGIIRAHGGEIKAGNSPAGGAVFNIEIPFARM